MMKLILTVLSELQADSSGNQTLVVWLLLVSLLIWGGFVAVRRWKRKGQTNKDDQDFPDLDIPDF